MTKGKLTASVVDLSINKGADNIFNVVVKDSTNKKVDITGYKYFCKVKKSAEDTDAVLEAKCKVLDGPNGVVEVMFSHEDTNNIDTEGNTYREFDEYTYDILQEDTSGIRTRIINGTIFVSPNVS